jgi:hypothetical protein
MRRLIGVRRVPDVVAVPAMAMFLLGRPWVARPSAWSGHGRACHGSPMGVAAWPVQVVQLLLILFFLSKCPMRSASLRPSRARGRGRAFHD